MRRIGSVIGMLAMLLTTLSLVAVATATAATPSCDGKSATIVRTPGDDVIIGTSGPDVIVAKGGDDTIDGKGGGDRICAGAGDDEVDGGGGPDRVFGSRGDDDIAGGRGNDSINGGSDSDRCVQNAGSGPIRKCETADFSITVDLPAAEDEGQTIQVDIIVTNNGPQRASYAVEIDNSNSGATCNGGLDGGIYPQPALDAGEQRQLPYDGMSCTHEGDPSSATVQATVRVNGVDPNAANNSDSDQVSIIAN